MSSVIPPLTRVQTTRIRGLFRDKHARQAEGTFIAEGVKAVRDLLRSFPSQVCSLVVTRSYMRREDRHDRRLREAVSCPSYCCPDHTFDSLSDLDTPQGILAVVRQPVWKEEDVLSRPSMFGLYGERIRDPLNVGTIIRIAAALDVTALWLTPDSADRYNPKVVRATSGALLSLPIFFTQDASRLVRQGCSVYAAEVKGPGVLTIDEIDRIPQRLILAVGNEGQGLSAQTRMQATCRFTIPLNPLVESLNVAATVAIATYHFQRQPKRESTSSGKRCTSINRRTQSR